MKANLETTASSKMPILFTNALSPFARKAMILNRLAGYPATEVIPERTEDAGYAPDVNPLGKVPALVLPSGQLVADSPVICEWLDARGPGLLDKATDHIAARSLHGIGDGLASAVYDYRYETARPHALHWNDMIERKVMAVNLTLAWLEANVSQLSSDRLCWGGLAVGCALDYCGFRFDRERPETPALDRWHSAICSGPEWQQTNVYADR